MKKRLKGSLTAKIFLLTVFMLFMVSGITYACIAKFLPVIYRNELEEGLQKTAENLKEELEKYSSIDEAKKFLEISQENEQTSVMLLDEEGEVIYSSEWIEEAESEASESVVVDIQAQEDAETENTKGDEVSETVIDESEEDEGAADESTVDEDEEDKNAADESAVDEDEEDKSAADESITDEDTAEKTVYGNVQEFMQYAENAASGDYDTWKGYQVKIGEDTYTMVIRGSLQAVNQAVQVLRRTFPVIMAVIGCVSLICAFAASFFITKPIMNLSRISGKMAALDFQERCRDNRSDELGVLARSLNELSDNLSAAMNDLKTANRKLKSDMEKEREEERKRTAFFAAASHELKTPVTILKGHLGGMLEKVGDYQNRDYYLERSYEVTETMEGMVQEILAVSRMESGAWEIKKERTDLAELMRLQAAELLELVENRRMKLQMDVPEHLYMEADSSMMVKVFRNFLVNAIRYSPEGADIRIHMQNSERIMVFSIENTGTHIPEESLQYLFDAFYRVEDSRNRKSGGSGLGLYIVRMILEQHGGFYGAENSRDGVRFWFRLPEDGAR